MGAITIACGVGMGVGIVMSSRILRAGLASAVSVAASELVRRYVATLVMPGGTGVDRARSAP